MCCKADEQHQQQGSCQLALISLQVAGAVVAMHGKLPTEQGEGEKLGGGGHARGLGLDVGRDSGRDCHQILPSPLEPWSLTGTSSVLWGWSDMSRPIDTTQSRGDVLLFLPCSLQRQLFWYCYTTEKACTK